MKSAVFYIHGYDGSPNNSKTTELSKHFDVIISRPIDYHNIECEVPQLASEIAYFGESYELTIVGSSLGGFVADYLSKYTKVPAVLINPLCDPNDILKVEPRYEYVDYLMKLYAYQHNGFDYGIPTLVLIDSGDELLDPSKATDKYNDKSRIVSFDGGSHRFDHIEEAMEEIVRFTNQVIV